MSEVQGPAEHVLARLQVDGAPHDGRILAAVVESAAPDLGLTAGQAAHLAQAAAAVGRAVHERGFDDPTSAAVALEVARVGHRVVVRIDDLGLPFDYDDADERDGAVLRRALAAGWVDEIHHTWRGREGNRTELVRHIDPGRDLRDATPTEPPAAVVPPDADLQAQSRLGTPDDADSICRLTWRTYGPTYQHDEYYQPERLAAMIEHGTQVSFVTVLDDGEVVGHSAVLLDEPGAVVVEAGRAMVDPRFRGHHLMRMPRTLRERWFAEHGVLAMSGAAVTAHTRSQRDGPITSVLLAFLPPIEFEGIDGTATPLREAVLGGFIPMAPIPPQTVHLPERDATIIADLFARNDLDRQVRPATELGGPAAARSTIDCSVHGDLGHAVLTVRAIGTDLPAALRSRLEAVAAAAIAVTYADLRLDDPAVSWAADVLADAGAIFAGIDPLAAGGVDTVRYQFLGDTPVDASAIHVKADVARELVDEVLAQHGGSP